MHLGKVTNTITDFQSGNKSVSPLPDSLSRFANIRSVGYGFVDFVSPLVILRVSTPSLPARLISLTPQQFEHAVGTPWPNSKKLCEVSFATFQGLDSLVEKFRNSAVMLEPFENQPRVSLCTFTPSSSSPTSLYVFPINIIDNMLAGLFRVS